MVHHLKRNEFSSIRVAISLLILEFRTLRGFNKTRVFSLEISTGIQLIVIAILCQPANTLTIDYNINHKKKMLLVEAKTTRPHLRHYKHLCFQCDKHFDNPNIRKVNKVKPFMPRT